MQYRRKLQTSTSAATSLPLTVYDEISEYSGDVVETRLHETETEIETETKNLFTRNMSVISKWTI